MAVFLGKHADKVIALIQSGFFDVVNGSVTVHIDHLGTIKKIEKHIIYNA